MLIQLRRANPEALRDALADGWLACAPRTLANQYAQDHSHAAEPDTRRRLTPGPGSRAA